MNVEEKGNGRDHVERKEKAHPVSGIGDPHKHHLEREDYHHNHCHNGESDISALVAKRKLEVVAKECIDRNQANGNIPGDVVKEAKDCVTPLVIKILGV